MQTANLGSNNPVMNQTANSGTWHSGIAPNR
jgi:hypothetical protein